MGSDGAAVMTGCHGGLAVLLRKRFAPWLINFHCAAHRLSLSAGALKANSLIHLLTTLAVSVNGHLCKSTPRQRQLGETAVRVGGKDLAVLRLIPTRWLCLFPVLQRLLTLLSGLTLYAWEAKDAVLNVQLTNLTITIAGFAMLPLLGMLNRFCLACQVRGVLSGELSQLLVVMLQQITAMYITPATRFGKNDFQQLHDYLAVGNPARSPLVYDHTQKLQLRLFDKNTDPKLPSATIDIPMSVRDPRPGPKGRISIVLHPVTRELFDITVENVQSKCTSAANLVVADIGVRFDCLPVVEALSVLYPEWWSLPHDSDQIQARFEVLITYFCKRAGLEGAAFDLAAPLDEALLRSQILPFSLLMRRWVLANPKDARKAPMTPEEDVELEMALEDAMEEEDFEAYDRLFPKLGASYATTCYLSAFAAAEGSVGEMLKLAEAVFVLVPVSVEDERMFSAMKFLKDASRNRLKQGHLTACARLFREQCNLQADDGRLMEEVIRVWDAACPDRGRYLGQAIVIQK